MVTGGIMIDGVARVGMIDGTATGGKMRDGKANVEMMID
jgi:hypothetical protein